MSSIRARSGLLAAALLCGSLLASPAVAQTAAEEDPRAEAGRRFDQGVAYYNEGRYDAALAEFLRAYEITGEWSILYNLGQVSYALGRNAAALDYLQRYVEAGSGTVDAERSSEVQRLIAELEPRVARLVIEVDIDGATVVVDGRERGTTPLDGPVLVEPGSHVVEVRDGRLAGGRERREVILAGGLSETVQVAVLAPSPPPDQNPVVPPLPPEEEASVWSSWWLWTIVGVVVVGGAVTAGVLLWPREETYTEGTVPPIVLGLGELVSVVRRLRRALLLLPVLAAAACEDQATEIFLTVRTDVAVPQHADRLVLSVIAESDSPETANFEQDYEYPLGAGEGQYGMPVRVSVRPTEHYRGRVTFSAELSYHGDPVVLGDAEATFRSGERVDATIDLPWAEAMACPGDPEDGTIGVPCDRCPPPAEGYQCVSEIAQLYEGEQYVWFADGYCLTTDAGVTNCSIVSDDCPAGSRCMPWGRDAAGLVQYICLDECNPVDADGVPYDINCDCRDGYTCEVASGVCIPGCSNDRECCERWDDANANVQREAGEVTLVAGCAGHCDPDAFRCVYEGGTGDFWSPCDHASQCGSGTDCLPLDAATLAGYCTVVGCVHDAAAAACDAHDGFCVESAAYSQCLRRCDPRVPLAESGCPSGSACHNFGLDTDGDPIGACYYVCATAADCGGRTCDTVSQGCVWE